MFRYSYFFIFGLVLNQLAQIQHPHKMCQVYSVNLSLKKCVLVKIMTFPKHRVAAIYKTCQLTGQLCTVPEAGSVAYTETSVTVPPLSMMRNGSVKRSRRSSGSGGTLGSNGRKASLGERTGK